MKRILLVLAMVAYAYALPKYKECPPTKDKCEFWLVVKERLTMMQSHGRPTLIKATKGKLYRFDEHPNNFTTIIPPSTVVTADGYRRMVIAINGTIPGPPLVVYEGQNLIIHVKNAMLSDTLTIHWHGMYQKGTNWMDGVAYITQCPIGAGESFTYKFKAKPKGTHWYHSHIGAQRTNGIFGALIVKEKPKVGKVYHKEAIMTVGEWEHETSEHSHTKMIRGNFKDGKRVPIAKTVDGGNFSPIPWTSGLIEGKGRYTDPHTGKSTETPFQWYDVKHGETYRFRVIHTGAQYPLRISVDGHDLVVVATDGHEIEPQTVESFIVDGGERYDFLLTCNKDVKNYWIRAVSTEVNAPHHSVEAVLNYAGASLDVEPTTTRRACEPAKKCKVLNCLWNTYPTRENIQCILMGDVKGNEKTEAPAWEAGSEEHFLNFVIPFIPGIGPISMVNGKVFNAPIVSSASQDNEIDPTKNCDWNLCVPDKVCKCNNELKVPYDKTIQMVWVNMGLGAHGSHPIHLHGHSFYLLKTVFPAQNATTGHRLKATAFIHPDIDCGIGDRFCSQPKWKNTAWNNGNVPGLNLLNPTRRDTIIVPNGGYVVLRIKSDNPGKWFMHCHIEVHAIDGMALVLAEGMDRLKPPPKGFPLCNNFYDDENKDVYRSNKKDSCDTVVTGVTTPP